MFTYAGYVTVNLSSHNCNGKFYNISGQKYKGNYWDLSINIYVYVHVPRICNCKHIWGLTQPQLQRRGGSKKIYFLIRNTQTQSKINPISWDVGESVLGFTTFTSRRLVCSESVDQEPSLRGGELDENSILGRTPRPDFTRIGPMQLVIYAVKNRHAGEQKSH